MFAWCATVERSTRPDKSVVLPFLFCFRPRSLLVFSLQVTRMSKMCAPIACSQCIKSSCLGDQIEPTNIGKLSRTNLTATIRATVYLMFIVVHAGANSSMIYATDLIIVMVSLTGIAAPPPPINQSISCCAGPVVHIGSRRRDPANNPIICTRTCL